jgi:hypothetical protein
MLTANAQEGSFKAIAAAAGVSGEVQFSLTNTAPPATALDLRIVSGAGQSATAGTMFAEAVRIALVDDQGDPVANRSVTFTLPAQGASASFAGAVLSAQAMTDAQGVAVSPKFTANATAGGYEMTVAATGATALRVGLTNTAVPADGKQISIATATGTGILKAAITGGGASCRFNPDKTFAKKAEGLVPLFGVLSFPYGLFEYELIGCDVGATVTITIVWPDLSVIDAYPTYGPTPTSRGKKSWYVPQNLKRQGNTVSYTITEGQLGDDDLTANGVIKDPGGPAIQSGPLPRDEQAIPVPGLSPLSIALLSLLLLLGWGSYRRRPENQRETASRPALTEVPHGE